MDSEVVITSQDWNLEVITHIVMKMSSGAVKNPTKQNK